MPLPHGRSPRLVAYTLTLLACIACGSGDAVERRAYQRGALSRSAVWADSIIAHTQRATSEAQVGAMDAVVVGYLERLRLGLGSPFRLGEYALRDPRLDDSTRVRLARALLERTARGASYDIDPAALEAVGVRGRWAPSTSGAAHRALIERTVLRANDPRAGEVAVRAAYAMARASGDVGRQALAVSVQAAALVRDRAVARDDARALIAEAERAAVDPTSLIASWRATGRFRAESAILRPLSATAEAEAMRAAVRLAGELRELAATSEQPDEARASVSQPHPALGPAAGRRLAALASVRGTPPQAPVAVTLRAYRDKLLTEAPGNRSQWAARARFLAQARNEESLAAAYATLAGGGAGGSMPALAVLSAAVAMRPLAQEAVWFPSMGGPSVAQLRDRWGIAAVSFDRTVPAEWRPYYLTLLATGIADLQRVMPALELRGVGFHFGASVMRDSALALHDPRTRTIYLPLATGGGTLAHEVAHDLDWQVARSAFGSRSGYSTDRAVREQRGRMALSLRGLTAATLIPPLPENRYRPPHNRRPAEVFARNADWFVAVSLAREGRMNGYLSAVQDELLTGYAGVLAPDVDGDAAESLANLLDDMTFIAPPTRGWFLRQYGPGRELGPFDLVRKVMSAPEDGVLDAALGRDHRSPVPWTPVSTRPDTLRWSLADASCDAAAAEREDAQLALTSAAAEARARGLLRRKAYFARSDGDARPALRALRGAPWSPALGEAAVTRARDALVATLAARDAAERPYAAAACHSR